MTNIIKLIFLVFVLLVNFNLILAEQNKVSLKINQKKVKIDNYFHYQVLNPLGLKLIYRISLEEYKYDTVENKNIWIEVVDNLFRNFKRDTIYVYLDENNEEKISFEYVENGKIFISYCATNKASDYYLTSLKVEKRRFKMIWYSNSKFRLVLYYKENINSDWGKQYSSEFEVYK